MRMQNSNPGKRRNSFLRQSRQMAQARALLTADPAKVPRKNTARDSVTHNTQNAFIWTAVGYVFSPESTRRVHQAACDQNRLRNRQSKTAALVGFRSPQPQYPVNVV